MTNSIKITVKIMIKPPTLMQKSYWSDSKSLEKRQIIDFRCHCIKVQTDIKLSVHQILLLLLRQQVIPRKVALLFSP